ncbi:PAS domain-containing sensor histidine kinase [Urechidicola croceus]|uniref:histidine kinase n=1 Tax=Urechidicola croceus TaxID=1850246 RepID=A0A1D8P7H4_9FLAO|nr:PAS domain S-box protein [Urechidicola croceus]AOW20498.1 PAS domain-containing sensor histidine kinase [Urechidicola croceus]
MSQKEIDILKRALYREKEARKQAEKILEDKATSLYNTSEELKESNLRLESLLKISNSELKGVFENIADAYIITDLWGNVIKMNGPAIKMLDFDMSNDKYSMMELVDPLDIEKVNLAIPKLISTGFLTDFRVNIITKHGDKKLIHINSSVIYNTNNSPKAIQCIVRDITEENRIKELLEEQKNQLNIIIDNSPIGISLSRENEKGLLLVNNSLCNMLGYSSDEFNSMLVQDLTHPEDQEISRLSREKLYSGEINSFNLEKRYLKKDGSILWAKTKVTAVRNNEGKINYQVATVEDITNERLAKERLIESEDRLAKLILNLDSAVLLEDENRKLVLTNNKFCELFYIDDDPEILTGYDCIEATNNKKILFENPDQFIKDIDTIILNKEPVFGDELRMKDGTILERNYIPIFNNNIYKGHLSTYRDVTLERNYRESIEAQRQKYSNIIANMNLGLVEVDKNDRIVMVNQSFAKMTGYLEDELIGKKGRDILPVEQDKSIVKEKGLQRKKGEADSFELRIKNKSGKVKYWLASGAPNYNLNGKIIGSIGVVLDITEIKNLNIQKEQLLKKLERSNNELQEYAHIVSHDLKSPLRSIDALVNWLKEDNLEKFDENSLHNVKLIEATLEKMENLITDILNYSSLSTELKELKPVDLNVVLEDLSKLLYFPKHIKLNILNKLPVINGDQTKLQQLFQNLISNAIRFIDKEQGLIEVDVKETKLFYQFSVKDNGIGIEEKFHDKIFKIFHSLNKSKESTGIGLSIVKKIIELYKGEIWLESRIGEGTTFFFTLKK